MTEKEVSSAKVQAEHYEKQFEGDKRITFAQYVKFLLSLPIGRSYEFWSYLHSILEEGGLE